MSTAHVMLSTALGQVTWSGLAQHLVRLSTVPGQAEYSTMVRLSTARVMLSTALGHKAPGQPVYSTWSARVQHLVRLSTACVMLSTASPLVSPSTAPGQAEHSTWSG
jgi:hypothetical protein